MDDELKKQMTEAYTNTPPQRPRAEALAEFKALMATLRGELGTENLIQVLISAIIESAVALETLRTDIEGGHAKHLSPELQEQIIKVTNHLRIAVKAANEFTDQS